MSPARWGHPGGCPPAWPARNVISEKKKESRNTHLLKRAKARTCVWWWRQRLGLNRPWHLNQPDAVDSLQPKFRDRRLSYLKLYNVAKFLKIQQGQSCREPFRIQLFFRTSQILESPERQILEFLERQILKHICNCNAQTYGITNCNARTNVSSVNVNNQYLQRANLCN
jgi:hypothetical protein